MAKRYYWLKLQDDFFSDKKIKKLRKIAGGDTYTIIYLKMQLLSVKNGGIIEYEGIEPTFADELALTLDEDVENVKITLSFLDGHGLISEGENGTFLLPEAAAKIGSESDSKERVRAYRERKRLEMSSENVTCNALVTNSNIDIDIDNRDRERNRERKKKQESDIDIYTGTSCSKGEKSKNKAVEILDGFDSFWVSYPRKVAKQDAIKAWKKLNPSIELQQKIIYAVCLFSNSDEWKKDNGQYIPYPATFLNGKRWEDEMIAKGKYDNLIKIYKKLEEENDKTRNGEVVYGDFGSVPTRKSVFDL